MISSLLLTMVLTACPCHDGRCGAVLDVPVVAVVAAPVAVVRVGVRSAATVARVGVRVAVRPARVAVVVTKRAVRVPVGVIRALRR